MARPPKHKRIRRKDQHAKAHRIAELIKESRQPELDFSIDEKEIGLMILNLNYKQKDKNNG